LLASKSKLSILLLLGMLSPNGYAIAQSIPTPVEPNRLPALPESLSPTNRPNPIKPPVKSPESPIIPPSTPAEIEVIVRQIKVLGSTVFSEAELQQAIAPYLGKSAKIQDLLAIRTIITNLYVNRGYLTSGAFLPVQSQDFSNGIISVQVVEGELEQIEIMGLSRLQEDYVRSRIAQAGTRPVNIRNLEEGLQLLQLNPLFSSIRAELKSGRTIGRSILQLELKENDPWLGSLILENRESPSVGSLGLYGSLEYRNLTGLGDSLSADIGGTEGTRKYGIRYNLPLNAQDELQFRYSYSTSRIIEQPFSSIDINSRSQTAAVGYRHFVFRYPTSELAVGLTLEQRQSSDFLFGNVPFSFSAGADNGRSVVNVLRFSQEWISRTTNQVLAARSQFNLGLGILGATVNDIGVDGRFLSWQGQFQWVQALAKDTISVVRLGTQLTNKALLPIEQFGIGGLDTVRGYRQNLYIGDSGMVGTLELRLPLVRNEAIGLIQVVPFIDIGSVWSSSPNTFSGILASTGLGVRWEVNANLRARLEWAAQLASANGFGNAAQPQSITFSLQLTGF
jgi:hemolysin activation/secretion protein